MSSPKGLAEVGAWLQSLRHSRNMTLVELGDRVGVTPMAISRYELGKREPDLQTIVAICTALDYHVEWSYRSLR